MQALSIAERADILPYGENTTGVAGEKDMAKMMLVIALIISLDTSACAYPQRRWQAMLEDAKRQAAQPRTKEGICRSRRGILYNEQCYTPSTQTLDEKTCRMLGGLYIDEQCLMAPQGRAAF